MKTNFQTKAVAILPILRAKGVRYVITDIETGRVMDDAQGYGFKTQEAAIKYATPKGWVVANQPDKLESNPLF